MIFEVHRKAKNNIGDLYCNPSRYFNIDCVSGDVLKNDFQINDNDLIIGGGGLIHKKFGTYIENMINSNPRTTTLWGVGHNFGKKHNQYYPKWINKCNLVGIRDWIDGYHGYYLPCVSCMHDAFDLEYNTLHDVVYYTHAYKTKLTNTIHPVLSNNELDFYKVIKFLASGDTVITDSYHGAYWAQLLGKNVQVASWSVKFDHLKHPPVFLNSINDNIIKTKNSIHNFLDECRDYNIEFYQNFLNLI